MAADTHRSDAVTRELRSEILRGGYRPGERLPPERDLARQHSVGRASVREALKRLEQLRLVVIRQGDGATVRSLDEASAEVVPHLLFTEEGIDREIAQQVLDVHEMLLTGATRLAVERGGDEELERARELLVQLGRADLGNEERTEIQQALFGLITRASGNLVLHLCRQTIGPDRLQRIEAMLSRRLRPEPEEVARQFHRIEEALSRRDASGTAEAVRALLRDRRSRLLAAIDELESNA